MHNIVSIRGLPAVGIMPKKELIQFYTQHIQSTIAPSPIMPLLVSLALSRPGSPKIHPDPLLIMTKWTVSKCWIVVDSADFVIQGIMWRRSRVASFCSNYASLQSWRVKLPEMCLEPKGHKRPKMNLMDSPIIDGEHSSSQRFWWRFSVYVRDYNHADTWFDQGWSKWLTWIWNRVRSFFKRDTHIGHVSRHPLSASKDI